MKKTTFTDFKQNRTLKTKRWLGWLTFCVVFVAWLPAGAQEFAPLSISSGFNEDVIAEDSPAATFTTTAVDATGSGANYAFMSIDYPGATVGLPANGLINSIATTTPGLSFQLAPYDDDNVLRINENGGEGTLVFANPQSALQIFVLATSGSALSNFTGVITFTDNSTQAISSQTVPDWYQTGANPVAIQGIGRISRGGGSPDNNSSNPKLFQVPITIETANQTKLIESISFTKTSSDSGFLNIFGVSAEITPDCPKPTDFTITGVSAGGATFSWADVGTDFELKYGTTGFDVETAGTSVGLTTFSYNLTDVTEGQTYDVYIRRDCDADGFSNWTGPITFTAENTITIGDGTDTGSGSTTIPVTNYNYTYSQQLVTASEYAAGGGVAGPITKIRYYVTNVGTSTVWNNWTVYIGNTTKSSFDSDTDWIPVSELTEVFSGTITAVANEWFEITFSEPFEYTGDNIVVAVDENTPGWLSAPTFLMYTSTENSGILYRNDSTNPDPADPPTATSRQSKLPQIQFVGTLASCLPPDNISATSITSTTATLNWTGIGQFDIEIVEEGEEPTGTADYTGVNSPFVTTTPLNPATAYEFYVRKNCGSGDLSAWSGPFSFMTACVSIAIPYTENFDTYGIGTDSYPNCWSRPVIYEGFPSIVSSPSVSSNSLKFRAATDEPTYAISPAFAEDIHNLRVRFYLQREGDSSGTIDVGVMSDPTDISTFELVQTIDQEEEDVFEEYTVYFNTTELTGENNYIAIRQNSDAQNWYYWVDDFVVEEIPSCIEPLELTVDDVSFNSADLSWTADGDLFDIEIVEAGEEPTGTPTETGVSNPHTAEGLDPSTAYEYYVRQDCGEDDGVSMWAGPFSFTTTQIPATLNYEQDFEGTHGWALNNGDQTNQWVVGSATGNTGNSLYISNDGGTTNAYSTSSTSVVQAYRDIAVPAGTFMGTISFDWKAEGESSSSGIYYYDYFRVWLVPASYLPVAGTQISSGAGRIQLGGNFNQEDEWQQYENTELDLSGFAGSTMRLVFEWRNDSSSGTQPPAAIDNIEITIPPCSQPMDLAVTGITKESADLSWASTGNTFDIKWEEAGFDVETEGTLVEGFANGGTLSDLASTTDYEFYVRQDCDGDGVSEWSGPYAFTTLCDYPDFEIMTEGEDLLFCGSGSVEIEVDSDGIINWYDTEDALVPVFMGTTYETEILNETTSFWVESATIQEEQNVQLGEGTSTDNSSGSPFYHSWGGYKYQYVYTAEELSNAGLFQGPISALAFDVTQAGTVNYNDFTIAIGTTEQSVATSTHISDLTQVYSNTAQATPVGINYYEFDEVFEWDGISNIVVQVNWSNNNSGSYSSSAAVRTHTTSSSQTTYTYADNRTAAQILATMTGSVDNGSGSTSGDTSTTTRRPNTYFNGTAICRSPREEVVVTISESDPILLSAESVEICEEESSELITITEGLENYDTYVWMPSVGVSGDEITGWTFSPETTTIYTLTASQSEGACTQVVTLEVLVNPLPEAQDLEDNYVVCPQAIQMISTGLSTSDTNGYDIVWSPFVNLYLDAAATTAYNGEIASTVYFVSEAFGETIYQATVTSHKGCEAVFTTTVNVPEVISPELEDIYLCVATSVDEAVSSTLNLVWYDSLESDDEINEFTQSGTYYVSNVLGDCKSERVAVEVTVEGVTTPTTESTAQQFCDNATINDLQIAHTNGSTLKVYETPTGGVALNANYSLYNGTFYVSEKIGDCESARLAIQVTITPSVPALSPAEFVICGHQLLSTIELDNLPNAELVWYANATTPQAMSASVQITSGTFYVSQKIGVCESLRVPIVFEVQQVLPQPTATSIQQFCISAIVSELVATGAPNAVFKWYASATSATPLESTATLQNGTYYVSQELNGCESARRAVSVIITNLTAPQATSFEFCGSATVADFSMPVISGVTYNWYLPNQSTPLPSTHVLTNGNYLVKKAQNGCESNSAIVQVTIKPIPNSPTGQLEQEFIDSAMISDLEMDQSGVVWYITYEDALNGNNPLQANMPLEDGNVYYAVLIGTNGCPSLPVAVTVTITLGVKDLDLASLKYYPNPVETELTVSYKAPINSLEVYDLTGKLIKTQAFDSNDVRLDVSSLSSGTYMIKVHTSVGSQFIKIVKK